MKRREFITLLGGAAAAWPLAARGQRPSKVRRRQFSAAIAAVREKGVLSGKRVERSERGPPGEFADLENMTADELMEFIIRETTALGISPSHVASKNGR